MHTPQGYTPNFSEISGHAGMCIKVGAIVRKVGGGLFLNTSVLFIHMNLVMEVLSIHFDENLLHPDGFRMKSSRGRKYHSLYDATATLRV